MSQIRGMIRRTEEAMHRLQGRREAFLAHGAETPLLDESDRLLMQSMVRLEKSKVSFEETFLSLERTLKQLKHHRRENERCAKQRAEQRLGHGPLL